MNAELWMWLANGLGYGAVNIGEVLAEYPGGALEVAQNLGSPKMDELLTQKQAERLAATRAEDFSLRLAHSATFGVEPVCYNDKHYPVALRQIGNPPPVLFAKGDISLLNDQLSIGIVGTRRPSAYGMEATKTIGKGVALGGAIIVSGLAAGLDAEAHKAALAVNGPTIACIAFGHDTCYPKNNKKLMELIETYGLVISEYPVGTAPEKPYFLQRNRIIAGLSHGLIVCEARSMSGTMSTVNYAADYGRDIFAVPGSIYSDLSEGTNSLIKEGAYLVSSPADVLSVYGIEYKEPPKAEGFAEVLESKHEQLLEQSTDLSNMTMAEALQMAAGKKNEDGSVSTKQAVDAFVKMRRGFEDKDNNGYDERSRMLDEMADAVSDDIQGFGNKVQEKPVEPPAPKKEEKKSRGFFGREVKDFSWSKAERLSKKEVAENLSGIPEEKPVEEKHTQPVKPPKPVQVYKSGAPRRNDAIEPVAAVNRVQPVYKAQQVNQVYPSAEQTNYYFENYQTKNEEQNRINRQGYTYSAPNMHNNENIRQENAYNREQPPRENFASYDRVEKEPAKPMGYANEQNTAYEEPRVYQGYSYEGYNNGNNTQQNSGVHNIATPGEQYYNMGLQGENQTTGMQREYVNNSVPQNPMPQQPDTPRHIMQEPPPPPQAAVPEPPPVVRQQEPPTRQATMQEQPKAAPQKQAQMPPRQNQMQQPRPVPMPNEETGKKQKHVFQNSFSPQNKVPPKQEVYEERHVSPVTAKVKNELKSARQVLSEEDISLTKIVNPANEQSHLSANALKALQYLSVKPKGLSQIVEESGLTMGQAMAALTELELEGLSQQQAGRQFVIVQ